MKWFTKGEIFTYCFNFDLNRSASKKKRGSKMSIFKPFSKNVSPLVNENKQGPSGGGPREKSITFLLSGRIIFCYHVNRFLTVSLLSEMFTQQNSNFQGENCLKKCNFWPKLTPLLPSVGFC